MSHGLGGSRNYSGGALVGNLTLDFWGCLNPGYDRMGGINYTSVFSCTVLEVRHSRSSVQPEETPQPIKGCFVSLGA